MSKHEEKAENASQILDKLLKYLLIEHVDYAIELGLQSIPVVEGPKTPPTFYFFTVIHQSNNIIHLLEKQYIDMVVPLVKYVNFVSLRGMFVNILFLGILTNTMNASE